MSDAVWPGAARPAVSKGATWHLAHLHQALALRQELGRRAAEWTRCAGPINLLDQAVPLLDGAGCVRFANVADLPADMGFAWAYSVIDEVEGHTAKDAPPRGHRGENG